MKTNFKPKSRTDVFSEIIHVTPDLANEWLSRNDKNRAISERSAARYAKSMQAGKWNMNGDTVKLAIDGTLLDGQHRLRAVVLSETSVPMLVVFNLPKEVFETIDTGKSRSAADAISIVDKENAVFATSIAAASRLLYAYQNNGNFSQRGLGRIDNYDVLEILAKNKRLVSSAKYAQTLGGAVKIVPYSALTVLHFLFNKKDTDDTEQFFHDLDTGEDLKEGDPVLVLRSKLFMDIIKKRRNRADGVIPYVIKAWNLRRAGKTIQILRLAEEVEYNID